MVESGKPTCEADRITAAPAPWAAKPCAGSILMIRRAHRADDPPAADVGAERDRGRRGDDRPRSGCRRRRCRFPLATSARKMIPIVFCASLVPCESENRLPVTELPEPEAARDRARATGGRRSGRRSRIAERRRRRTRAPARRAPGSTTFSTQAAARCTALGPCGGERRARPRRRSARARTRTAARSTRSRGSRRSRRSGPAKTISSVIDVGVDDARGDRRRDRERQERADEVQRSRPCATATRGGIARVEIEVAIALAVSWKPLVKSKASAVADDDPEDDVGVHRPSGS